MLTTSAKFVELMILHQTTTSVRLATALLIGSELWGFVAPATVDLTAVITATNKVQPYYAVPTRWMLLEDFPYTRYVHMVSGLTCFIDLNLCLA